MKEAYWYVGGSPDLEETRNHSWILLLCLRNGFADTILLEVPVVAFQKKTGQETKSKDILPPAPPSFQIPMFRDWNYSYPIHKGEEIRKGKIRRQSPTVPK